MRGRCGKHRYIGIPKGFLWHISVQLLKKEPMSGSEIMEKLLEYAGYKPSPGSVYPLLAQLQEEGLIEEIPDEDPSLKRYGLTERGRATLAESETDECHIKERHKTIRKLY